MTELRELQFYSTPEHSCSYIKGNQAKTLFVDPKAALDQQGYSVLSDLGFRRSGPHIYRPHCDECSACISTRLPVDLFKLSKSQKRIIRKNRDLTVTITRPYHSDDIYRLYETYIGQRHSDGDMYPSTSAQFESFLVDSNHLSYFYEFRLVDRLICVAVVDRLDQGLSAIYTFFDPEYKDRSLGHFAILKLIDAVKDQGMPFLYLGYWIKGCQKMDYKIQYRPIQLLVDGQWFQINKQSETSSL